MMEIPYRSRTAPVKRINGDRTVLHTIERIGEVSENPFEGSPNDVSITALFRTIEIDLREMLDESGIPPKIEPKNNTLM